LDVRYGSATGRPLKALIAIMSSGSSSISAAAQAGFASAPGQHNNAAGTEYEHNRHAASAINGAGRDQQVNSIDNAGHLGATLFRSDNARFVT